MDAIEKLAIHLLGAEAYNNSPCNAHPGELIEQHVAELKAELERERMRLVACGVVAMANTRGSAVSARSMDPDYRSASLDGVIRAVDAEMRYREALDALRKQTPVYFISARYGDGIASCSKETFDAAEFDPERCVYYAAPVPPEQSSAVAVPEALVWNQVTGREGKIYVDGWNACRDKMLAAAPKQEGL